MRGLLPAVAAWLALLTTSGTAHERAHALDPSRPQRRAVGPPRGAAPQARLDGARRGLSALPLPHQPRLVRRLRLPAALSQPLAVADGGRLSLPSAGPELLELEPGGRLAWRAALSDGPSVVEGTLMGSGARVSLLASGLLGLHAPTTGVARAVQLPLEPAPHVSPLALSDGTLALAGRREVLIVDDTPSVLARATLTAAPHTLLEVDGAVIVVQQDGSLWRWQPPRSPRLVRRLGLTPLIAARCGAARVCVAVPPSTLLEVELDEGLVKARVDVEPRRLQPLLAISREDGCWLLTADRTLARYDAGGSERWRTRLEPAQGTSSSSAPGAPLAPPLLADTTGRLAVLLPSEPLRILTPEGAPLLAEDVSCADPIAVAPLGPRRLVVACRSGELLLVGDAAP